MSRFFYADAVYGKRVALLAGPFDDEPTARAALETVTRLAMDADPRAAFALFGTLSTTDNRGPGRFNSAVAL